MVSVFVGVLEAYGMRTMHYIVIKLHSCMIILITSIPPLGGTRTAWETGKVMNSSLIFAGNL